MSTYLKLCFQYPEDKIMNQPGGLFLHAVTGAIAVGENQTRLLHSGLGKIVINLPLEEVEKVLITCATSIPPVYDWRIESRVAEAKPAVSLSTGFLSRE